jgi:hypothetical protein
VTATPDADVAHLVESSHAEVRALLPTLPPGLEVELVVDASSRLVIPGLGVGGIAMSLQKVTVIFDPTFAGDREGQLHRLRAAVYHECFHAAHGFTVAAVDFRTLLPLHDAVCEGAATVFERERAGSDPPWGRYLDEATMLGWLGELAALSVPYDMQRWKFWDAVTRRQWIVYRAGTFAVDRALARHTEVRIEQVASMTPDEILELAELGL